MSPRKKKVVPPRNMKSLIEVFSPLTDEVRNNAKDELDKNGFVKNYRMLICIEIERGQLFVDVEEGMKIERKFCCPVSEADKRGIFERLIERYEAEELSTWEELPERERVSLYFDPAEADKELHSKTTRAIFMNSDVVGITIYSNGKGIAVNCGCLPVDGVYNDPRKLRFEAGLRKR